MSRLLLLTLFLGLPAVRAAPAPEPPARFQVEARIAPAASARFGLRDATVTPTEARAAPRFSITTPTTKGVDCSGSADAIFRNGFEN